MVGSQQGLIAFVMKAQNHLCHDPCDSVTCRRIMHQASLQPVAVALPCAVSRSAVCECCRKLRTEELPTEGVTP